MCIALPLHHCLQWVEYQRSDTTATRTAQDTSNTYLIPCITIARYIQNIMATGHLLLPSLSSEHIILILQILFISDLQLHVGPYPSTKPKHQNGSHNPPYIDHSHILGLNW